MTSSSLLFVHMELSDALLIPQIKRYGIGTLWYGAVATAAATFVGHYPVNTSFLVPIHS
jgi:hypothetical protein